MEIVAKQIPVVLLSEVEDIFQDIALQTQSLTSWTNVNVSITTDYVSVFNNQLLANITIHENGSAGVGHWIQKNIVLVGSSTYTYSCWVKLINRNWIVLQIYNSISGQQVYCFYNVATGVVGTTVGTLIDVDVTYWSDGWYLCWFSFTASITGNYIFYIMVGELNNDVTFDGLDQDSLYVFGVQIESGSSPSRSVLSFNTQQINLKASPTEYKPFTFMLRSSNTQRNITIEKTDLICYPNIIMADNIDIKVVKSLYQGDPLRQDITSYKSLMPKLLVNDDKLITSDLTDSYLKVSGSYIKITDTSGISGVANWPLNTDFPVQDSDTLQPFDIEFGCDKQIWTTVKIPSGSASGNYIGNLYIKTGNLTIKALQVCIQVLPITLLTSSIKHSLFYRGYITSTSSGTISSEAKNETQFVAEMNNLLNHGITCPTLYAQPNDYYFERALQLRQQAGIDNSNLYYNGMNIITTTTASALSASNTAAGYGTTQLYIYGVDETDLTPYTSSIDEFHTASIKVFCAQNTEAMAQNISSRLDLNIYYTSSLNSSMVELYHSSSNKVFSYSNPAASVDVPNLYRHNYGIWLWQNDYDGEMIYAYQHAYHNIWNDFDDSTLHMRDFSLAYPTVNGVIDTLKWEAFREGITDLRYIATLENLISSSAKPTGSAQTYIDNLKTTNLLNTALSDLKSGINLDDIRLEIIDYILYFLS